MIYCRTCNANLNFQQAVFCTQTWRRHFLSAAISEQTKLLALAPISLVDRDHRMLTSLLTFQAVQTRRIPTRRLFASQRISSPSRKRCPVFSARRRFNTCSRVSRILLQCSSWSPRSTSNVSTPMGSRRCAETSSPSNTPWPQTLQVWLKKRRLTAICVPSGVPTYPMLG